MTDYDTLFAAILDDPTDDLPRLAMADWLDENGQGERAASIRYALWVAQVNAGLSPAPVPAAYWHDDLNSLPQGVLGGKARGFICSISLTLADFMRPGIAPALFAAAPIEEVRLTDRKPSLDGYGKFIWWGWSSESFITAPDDLPKELWDYLVTNDESICLARYDSEALALEALARACALYGRAQRALRK